MGFAMNRTAHIWNGVAWIALFILLLPLRAFSGELHVYLKNTDHISGEELRLDESSLSILTPHCGQVVIERSAVKGISRDLERAEEILGFTGEPDLIHNRNGDRLSGKLVQIKDDTVFIKAFFAGDGIIEVKVEQLDYLVFASQQKAQPTSGPEDVRVIFTNGDVISGKAVGFEAGRFVLDPPYSEKLRFGAGAFRSLHNAKHSREFFEGGIAEALMDVLERSGQPGGNFSRVFPALVKSFLKEGDERGAQIVLRRISPKVMDQYVFQMIGDEFLANNMPDAAVRAYEKMLEKSSTYYYAYSKLFNAYVKMRRYSEAAAIYERMLSNPTVRLSTYGMSVAKIRTDLSDVYIKLKEYGKAADQLRQIIASPTEKEDTRKNALSKLIGIFKRLGKIESLIEKYNAELAENEKLLGESYLEMVRIYLDEGKIMKAKSYLQRLDELGLAEYSEKGRQFMQERGE